MYVCYFHLLFSVVIFSCLWFTRLLHPNLILNLNQTRTSKLHHRARTPTRPALPSVGRCHTCRNFFSKPARRPEFLVASCRYGVHIVWLFVSRERHQSRDRLLMKCATGLAARRRVVTCSRTALVSSQFSAHAPPRSPCSARQAASTANARTVPCASAGAVSSKTPRDVQMVDSRLHNPAPGAAPPGHATPRGRGYTVKVFTARQRVKLPAEVMVRR